MLTKKQLALLSDLVQDQYGMEGLASCLDSGVKLLCYTKKDSFETWEISSVIVMLKDIIDILRYGKPHSNNILTQKQLALFSALVQDQYSLERLTNMLDLGTEMLFYIKKGKYKHRKIRNIASAIRAIVAILRLRR